MAALRDSSAMAAMQMRALAFLARTVSTTAAMLPLVPPMNTASGAGRASSAAGARPSMRERFHAANFSRFRRMRAQASGSHSTAYTCPCGAASASSTLTLPVPAPTSHRVSAGRTASLASAAARTSCLVMGTSPRMKASSGRPGVRRSGCTACSTSRTLREAKVCPASSCAVPKWIFSSGVPRFSPTRAWASPSPAAVSAAHRVAGVSAPPVRKNTVLWFMQADTGSQAQPWAETRVQSCQGRPTAAASSCTLERPGSTRQEMPKARSMGSSWDAPE